MADRNWRFTLAAVALPLLLLAMCGSARALNFITVDTTSPTSVSGHCNLSDAIQAANSETMVNGCAAGAGGDAIVFTVTGDIAIAATLNVTDPALTIVGPTGGITIDGSGNKRVFSLAAGIDFTLENLTIANGFVSGPGGGIEGGDGDVITISDCTFTNDFGKNDTGGAIFAQGNSNSVVITNSTFVGDVAQFGGAIYDAGGAMSGSSLDITNSTFWHNFSSAGGADIASKVNPSLRGNVFANVGQGIHCAYTAATDLGYNISDDDSCDLIEPPSGTSVNNSTTLNLDPAGLQNNGGPTQTVALEPDSQAVDFIPVADCVDQSMPPVRLMTDQRGFPRPDPGNPDFCDAGAYELQTTPFVLEPNSERLQIVHSSTPSGNQLNTAFTFTENGYPSCNAADDAFNGVSLALSAGSCAAPGDVTLDLGLGPFTVVTVNHESYGTYLVSESPVTLSARMVELPTPAAPACGEWTLNVELTGFDVLSLLGDGPYALTLSNSDGDQGCFDITNAIVGNQIDPPTRTVRRGVRR
jgi:hypothetical protein